MAEKEIRGLAARWEGRFGKIDPSTVEPVARLGAVSRLLERFHREALKPFGLLLSDYQVLSSLLTSDSVDEMAPTRLCEILRQTPAGMTKTLDRLESRGAIRRVPRRFDRRSVCIELTVRGERLAERTCLAELEAQQDLFSAFTRKELVRFNGFLSRLLETLDLK